MSWSGGRAGGSTTFTLGTAACVDCSVAASSDVLVHIVLEWAEEITWNDGLDYGPYEDNSDVYEQVSLSVGEHNMYEVDSYGDGWHGGWWEVLDGCGRPAGGQPDGVVETLAACSRSRSQSAASRCRKRPRRRRRQHHRHRHRRRPRPCLRLRLPRMPQLPSATETSSAEVATEINSIAVDGDPAVNGMTTYRATSCCPSQL